MFVDLQGRNYAAFIDSSKYGTAIMGGFKGYGTAAGKEVDQSTVKFGSGALPKV